jgi:hypothetical protein
MPIPPGSTQVQGAIPACDRTLPAQNYPLPGRRLYCFKRGAGVEPLAGGIAPTPPLNQDLWAGAEYLLQVFFSSSLILL